ncbi:tetratricopeptide repeat protein [Sphingomicrobium sp. XHP0235]|uniref:tetratricopeptide repeat protein n=1 Tax=Sphingomicrobium aquimarinum TaxID=3133971 RepID=UPI0031FEFCCE
MILSALMTMLLFQPAPERTLDEAHIALDAGRVEQADLLMRRAATQGADTAAVQALAADVAFLRGDYAQAFAYYHHQLLTFPDNRVMLERAALSALKADRMNDAGPLLARAVRVPGASWVTFNAAGVVADRQGRFAEAREHYARASALAPSSATPVANLGWSLMLEGRWADARAPLGRALQLDPTHARARANLAMLDHLTAADLPLRTGGETDADFAARLNDAGVAAAVRGDTKRAVAAFTRAIAARPVYYERAAHNLEAVEARR